MVEKGDKKSGFFLEKLSAIKGFFKAEKIKKVITIFVVFLVVAIFAVALIPKKEKQESHKIEQTNSLALAYCEQIENRLISILKGVKGIGKVDAFVMVDSSPTLKYLEEGSTSTSNDNKTQTIQTTAVIVKNGSITSPVVVVELLPKITGVLIVATGAKDIKLKTTIINVVSSVLTVDVSKVEVLEGKA